MADDPTVPASDNLLIPELFLAEQLISLSGPPKVGLTTFALQFMRDMRASRRVLGFDTRPLHTVFVSCGESVAGPRVLMRRLGMDPHDYSHFSLLHQLDKRQGIEWAVEHATTHDRRAKLVILDDMSVLTDKSLNHDAEASTFLSKGIAYCQRVGITVMGVLPASKARNGEGYALLPERIGGSSKMSCMCKGGIFIDFDHKRDITSDLRRITVTSIRRQAFQHYYRLAPEGFEPTGIVIAETSLDGWLASLAEDTIITSEQIRQVAAGFGKSADYAYDWIKAQVDAGRLLVVGRGPRGMRTFAVRTPRTLAIVPRTGTDDAPERSPDSSPDDDGDAPQ